MRSSYLELLRCSGNSYGRISTVLPCIKLVSMFRKSFLRVSTVATGGVILALYHQRYRHSSCSSSILKGYCELGPNGKPCFGNEIGHVKGEVRFEDDGEKCRIYYRITGLKPGYHGFHIHEFANFENGCLSAGPHYNPHGNVHGGRCDEERHVGDLGNVCADSDGVAQGVFTDRRIKLSGEFSVVGRSVMVHADEDDRGKGDHSLSLTTGNAGARVACGEIRLLS